MTYSHLRADGFQWKMCFIKLAISLHAIASNLLFWSLFIRPTLLDASAPVGHENKQKTTTKKLAIKYGAHVVNTLLHSKPSVHMTAY